MTRNSIVEWGRIAVGNEADAISSKIADQFLYEAEIAQKALRVGHPVLSNRVSHQKRELIAGHVVGVLKTPAASLEILPKIDSLGTDETRHNLIRMLARTRNINISNGNLADLGHQRFDILEVLIRLFCEKTFSVIHRGLPRHYIHHHSDLTALRGRLDIKRQFTNLAASPQRLSCYYDDLSANIPLNQCLKAAVRKLRAISRSSENQRQLIEIYNAFADVSDLSPRTSLSVRPILDRTNRDWHDLFHLAELILGDRFQNTNVGPSKGHSLLFDMNKLFEEFIGVSLRRNLRMIECEVTLQSPRKFAACNSLTGINAFMTIPDIVIHRNSKPVMILDTKWKILKELNDDFKQGVSHADLYQLMAYAQIYHVERLGLIYPHHSKLGRSGTQSIFSINGENACHVNVSTINLSNVDSVSNQLFDICKEMLALWP